MYSNKNIKTIETVLNYELKLVIQWMKLNKLSLNTKKTHLILFHSRQNILNKDNIKINNKRLKLVDHIKYLGMCLDKHLSWDEHIKQRSSKLSRANGILSKLRHNAPLTTCLQVYYALFYSYLSYGCAIWGLTSKYNINTINNLQNKCLRIITSDFCCHTNQIFIDLRLLKENDIISTQQLKLIFEFRNDLLPSDLQTLFTLNKNFHKYQTSSSYNEHLCLPKIQTTTFGCKSIRYQGLSIWYQLVKKKVPINQSKSIKSFKSTLSKHYFAPYRE